LIKSEVILSNIFTYKIMKVDRSGQAAIISDREYVKIFEAIESPKHRLLLAIARYTGERWGAIVQLRREDVFNGSKPREHITFRACTRKASPSGARHTRQVPVHPRLREILQGYSLNLNHSWLFTPLTGAHAHTDRPMTFRAADLMFRSAIEKAGMADRGFSTHSTRRTFITRMWERGCDLHTISLVTGHRSLQNVVRYIDSADPNRIRNAIALL
jgi:integrase/recombinase XerD